MPRGWKRCRRHADNSHWFMRKVPRYYLHLLQWVHLSVSDHVTIEVMNCVKVELAVLGSPSLISLMVSVDVKQHWTMHTHWSQFVPNMSTRHPRTLSSTSSCDYRGHELCESRVGRSGLPVHNKPYGFCGRKHHERRRLWLGNVHMRV